MVCGAGFLACPGGRLSRSKFRSKGIAKSPFWPGFGNPGRTKLDPLRLESLPHNIEKILSDDDVKRIHFATLDVLNDVGIRLPHREALELRREL